MGNFALDIDSGNVKFTNDGRRLIVQGKDAKITASWKDSESSAGVAVDSVKIKGKTFRRTGEKGSQTETFTFNDNPNNTSKPTIRLYPEDVLKIFKRISDEDVNFMGFSSVWSRPDWFICQTLAVPPPSVRPSVKHDSQQRSEDDISHIIVNIIKANKEERQ